MSTQRLTLAVLSGFAATVTWLAGAPTNTPSTFTSKPVMVEYSTNTPPMYGVPQYLGDAKGRCTWMTTNLNANVTNVYWGGILGTLTGQTDLQARLAAIQGSNVTQQARLVSVQGSNVTQQAQLVAIQGSNVAQQATILTLVQTNETRSTRHKGTNYVNGATWYATNAWWSFDDDFGMAWGTVDEGGAILGLQAWIDGGIVDVPVGGWGTNGYFYAKSVATLDLARALTEDDSASLTNGYVKMTVTNGLAPTAWVRTVTNALTATVVAATNANVAATVAATNASMQAVIAATNASQVTTGTHTHYTFTNTVSVWSTNTLSANRLYDGVFSTNIYWTFTGAADWVGSGTYSNKTRVAAGGTGYFTDAGGSSPMTVQAGATYFVSLDHTVIGGETVTVSVVLGGVTNSYTATANSSRAWVVKTINSAALLVTATAGAVHHTFFDNVTVQEAIGADLYVGGNLYVGGQVYGQGLLLDSVVTNVTAGSGIIVSNYSSHAWKVVSVDTNILFRDGTLSMSGTFLPANSNAYDLGSYALPFRYGYFRELRVSTNGIDFGGIRLLRSGARFYMETVPLAFTADIIASTNAASATNGVSGWLVSTFTNDAGYLKADGSVPVTGDMDWGRHTISNLAGLAGGIRGNTNSVDITWDGTNTRHMTIGAYLGPAWISVYHDWVYMQRLRLLDPLNANAQGMTNMPSQTAATPGHHAASVALVSDATNGVSGWGYVTQAVTNGLESSAHASATYLPKAGTNGLLRADGTVAMSAPFNFGGQIATNCATMVDTNRNGVIGDGAMVLAGGCAYNGVAGYLAMYGATNCNYNGVSGSYAMYGATNCDYNGVSGTYAMKSAKNCDWNGAVGHYALWTATNATYSAALGSYAGKNATGAGRIYVDSFTSSPGPAYNPTNSALYVDKGTTYIGRPDKTLYLRGTVRSGITNGLAPTAWVRQATGSLAHVAGTVTNGHVAVWSGARSVADGKVTAAQLADAVAYAGYMASNVTATTSGTYTLGNAAHYYLTTTGAVTFAMAAANKYATSVWLLGTNAVSFPAAWKNYNNTWVKAASGTNLVYVAPQGTNWVYTGGSASL